ncbi:MAG: hypothetical protein ABIQ10_16110 [Gemmatimonadaceae bacterium]
MTITINARKRRSYTRAALWWTVTTNAFSGAVLLILGIAGSSYLIRTFDLSPTIAHLAVALVFLPFAVTMAMDLYRISMLPSVVGSTGLELDALGSAASGPLPANPSALLEFEQRMVDITRPFAWARAIADVILGVMLVALTVVLLRHLGRLDSSTTVPYLFGAMFVLVVVGGTVSDVYRTWALFSIPLDQKTNVVVKPVEQLLLVTWLGLIAAFDALFIMSRSPQLILLAVVVGVIGAAMTIQSYRQTVSRAIVNPIDVAPITIDAGETITLSIAGVTIAAGGLLQKVGFGRRVPQQFFTPESGRKLNPWGQNAFLVSETRVYFIFVPIALGDQALDNMSMIESLLGGKHIRAKLDDMLRTMTLRQIYESNPINFALNLSDISRVDVLKRTGTRQDIAFVDGNGDRIRAIVDESPDLEEFEAFAQRGGIGRSAVDA